MKATAKASRMVDKLGAKAAVSQLSWSCQAMSVLSAVWDRSQLTGTEQSEGGRSWPRTGVQLAVSE